jgi:hypothetical protein
MLDPAIYERGIHAGMGPGHARTAEPRGQSPLPPGTVVVSTDNHWSLTEDVFWARFPDYLRDRAARIVQDEGGVYDWYVDGKSSIPAAVRAVFGDFERLAGCTKLEPRLQDLDNEGVEKEIVFGNWLSVCLNSRNI